jgi:prolyl-tRNA editing enzyme YbaK/EbsC (Cys-tRNA(Pro) deacylase)
MIETTARIELVTGANKGIGFEIARGIGKIGGSSAPRDLNLGEAAGRLSFFQRGVTDMKPATAASALKVQATLGPTYEVLEFEASTRTAAEAATAIGCTIAEIAKSLVFRAEPSGRAVLVIASGVNRVDEAKVAGLVGETIARADADFVRAKTGFSIGGVPPVGHVEPPLTLIDESLGAFETIWAAAGTPNAVFRLTPADLLRLTGGKAAAVAP